ncbi:MAG: GNAT family N-acetyltransferase [Candidatus Micrarchaeales archaeon]
MEIRELKPDDMHQLAALILSVYADSALSMWFEKKPDEGELKELFTYKLASVKKKKAIDIVAVEKNCVIGECEIVVQEKIGKIGMIIEGKYRGKGVGTSLLEYGINKAKKLGIVSLVAEVAKENKGATAFFERSNFVLKGISERSVTKESGSHEVLYLELRLT